MKQSTKISIAVISIAAVLFLGLYVREFRKNDSLLKELAASQKTETAETIPQNADKQANTGEEKTEEAAAIPLPERFDLRKDFTTSDGQTHNVISPVKFQNPFGTCWGFAVIAAAEGSLQADLLERGKISDSEFIDLSERHLAIFTYKGIEEPEELASPLHLQGYYDVDGSWVGEGIHARDASDITSLLNFGGFAVYGAKILSEGIGPYFEEDIPYKNEENAIVRLTEDSEEGYEIIRLTPEEMDAMSEEEKESLYCYSDVLEDGSQATWDLPEDLRYGFAYVLKDSLLLPDTRLFNYDGYYTGLNEDAVNAIKEEIYHGYPVSIGFHADQSQPEEEGAGIYVRYDEDGIYNQYTYTETEGADHAVTIIGWDDTYSRDNFVKNPETGEGPAGDGAWIIKNSWGSEENEFPHRSNFGTIEDGKTTGYFHLSYYDETITEAESFHFDTDISESISEIVVDSYDHMVNGRNVTFEEEDLAMGANIFEAEYDQLLNSLSYFNTVDNAEVHYEVYLLEEDATDPTDGDLVVSVDDFYKIKGFHRVFLEGTGTMDAPVSLKKGQRYSVVVTETTKHNYFYFQIPCSEGYLETAEPYMDEIETYVYNNVRSQEYSALYEELFEEVSRKYPGMEEDDLTMLINAKYDEIWVTELKNSDRIKKRMQEMTDYYIKDYLQYYRVGVVNEGESFVYTGGEWVDETQIIQDIYDGDEWHQAVNMQYDNLPIKAYSYLAS